VSKPLIGIGLISYNRAAAATDVAESIAKTLDHDKYDYKLVCSLDQPDATGYERVGQIMTLLPHKNVGISINKSIAMMHLQNCDHLFLFEDDFKPVKKGWDTLYLNVHRETDIGLFNYCPQWVSDSEKRPKKIIRVPSGTVVFEYTHVAQIMSITRRTLTKVGALDPAYIGYGYEHCDYTRRCILAGEFPRAGFPFIRETYDCTDMVGCPNTTSDEQRKPEIDHNGKVYARGVSRILVPFADIAPHYQR
jgi:hypothetical protein